MMKSQEGKLVIVESPTKAKTLSRFLGKDYRIEATMGHIRDLPKERLGVNINRDFEPYYVVQKEKKEIVKRLREIVKTGCNPGKRPSTRPKRGVKPWGVAKALTVILATDPDREGEAIAWHVREVLNNKTNKKNKTYRMSRIVFHEITKRAVEKAFKHPRDIDMNLVSAQQARRILDRLVGYKLSPLLWYKTGKNWLSAGRVQSVAVRLICERERKIEEFKPKEYWLVEVELKKQGSPGANFSDSGKSLSSKQISEGSPKRQRGSNSLGLRNGSLGKLAWEGSFLARLVKIGEERAEIKNKEEAEKIVSFLKKAQYQVEKVEKKTVWRLPPPPFITSSMQRAGANFFGWPARKTMTLAQNLYEQGLITYHRTDSVQLSKEALRMARDYINKVYGEEYLPAKARIFKTKSKLAQEAHEAIRPTSLEFPSTKFQIQNRSKTQSLKFKRELGKDHQKLLDLITKRFLASQMREEEVEVRRVEIAALPEVSYLGHLRGVLEARGERVVFEGWRKIYIQSSKFKVQSSKFKVQSAKLKRKVQSAKFQVPSSKQAPSSKSQSANTLPFLEEKERLDLVKVLPQQKFTQPPPRYNEASLIKTLEEKGIGRPSTYAPIISTIQARHYVEKEERRFKPTELGRAINDFLVKNFPDIIDVSFTAKMEDELDAIAQGRLAWVAVVRQFWGPFSEKLSKVKSQKSKVKVKLEKVEEKCPQCGGQLVVRLGRFGKFLACSNFPKCKFTKPWVKKVDAKCPKCGRDIVLKKSRRGRRFFGCSNYPQCDFASWRKPNRKQG